MQKELTLARALRDQLHRAMVACTAELEQTSALLDETLAKLHARYPATSSQQPTDQRCAL